MSKGQSQSQTNDHHIQIAVSGEWISIHPGLQHTLVADLVLSNQFEALVGVDQNGLIVPLAAKTWTISNNATTYTFRIDVSRRFSDGTPLTSNDFKRSWEEALRLEPKSANSSLQDVLYKIVGFEQFQTTGCLPGIECPDQETLLLHFKSPFRMALDHLHGNRFAAFREREGSCLGTGKYEIQEQKDKSLLLTPSPYAESAKSLTSIRIVSLPPSGALPALTEGKLDAYVYATSRGQFSQKSLGTLSMIAGQDAIHETIAVNAIPGHFFEKKELRQALQFLVTKRFSEGANFLGEPPLFSADTQIYLPRQAGRISTAEASAIVENGKWLADELIEATRKQPLVVYTSEEKKWFIQLLQDLGLKVSEKSKIVGRREFFEVIYKSTEPDLVTTAFSVSSGDPDGIYHVLGHNGAIVLPITQNAVVAGMLEHGRKLLDLREIDRYYQDVSRAILSEVPYIHLGFSKTVTIYRGDRIKVHSSEGQRNEGHFHIFAPLKKER